MNSLTGIWQRILYRDLAMRLQLMSTSVSSTDIQIPSRIERGPTDILKALEATVVKGLNIPHYKFIDDPFLIPLNKQEQRAYALARESGKKAAMWVRKEHANLFGHRVADPEIAAFLPSPVYTDKNQVSEELLLNLILTGDPSTALEVYNLLKGEVSNNAKQSLLELLCFYNNLKTVSIDLLEEKWYQHTYGQGKNTWVHDSDIAQLFTVLTANDETAPAAYNTLICGLTKYNNSTKAWELYEECIQKQVLLNVKTLNNLILMVPFLRHNEDKAIGMIKDLFREITNAGYHPTLHTFNCALKVTSMMRAFVPANTFTLALFAEMKRFNIKPSLASYYFALCTFRRGQHSEQHVKTILDELENEFLTVQDANDASFFPAIMDVTASQICDRTIGDRIHKLLLSHDNYKFITDGYKESIYFRAYILLVLNSEPFDRFFNFYENMVPHIYIPEPSVMRTILLNLKEYPIEKAGEYILKLWSHTILFDFLKREEILSPALSIMCDLVSKGISPSLHGSFAEAAVAVWEHILVAQNKPWQYTPLKATIHGDIMLLLLNTSQFDKTLEILSYLVEGGSIIGILTKEQTHKIADIFIVQGHTKGALMLLKYAVNGDIEETELIARRIHTSLPLTIAEERQLLECVGKGVLEENVSNDK